MGEVKQGRRNGNRTDSDLIERLRIKTWWDKINYGDGKQHFPVTTQIFDPKFLPDRSQNEINFLLLLTFVAWKNEDWIIWASEPFIQQGLAHRGLGSSGSIKRHKNTWLEAGHLRRTSLNTVKGNDYLVSSILLKREAAQEMANYDLAVKLAADAKAKVQQALKRAEMERRRAQQEWALAVREAKAAGRPLPDAREWGLVAAKSASDSPDALSL